MNTITPDDINFDDYMADNEHRAKVLPATSWRTDLEDACDTPHRVTGATLPWPNTHDHVRFRLGETTIWAGENGSGKSQLLGMVQLAIAAQNERSCTASFEMKPLATLQRQMRQAATCSNPTRQFAGQFANWLRGRVWIYDHQGQIDPLRLFAVIRYCADKLKIKHMIIDSMMKCVRGEDDYNGQKNFVDMLTVLARDLKMHIHLIHHVRKSDDDSRPQGKNAIKGSGAITDQVDQVMIVWRNRPKERAVAQLLQRGVEVDEETANKPDSLLMVEKNRHGEWEGRIPLWFHRDSLQYVAYSHARPINLMGGLV